MKDDSVYLSHILEKTTRILEVTASISFEEFSSNYLISDSVIRSLEVIGEASNKLSESFRMENPDIPIRQMVGLRNILIHAYSDVDLKRVWMIAKTNVPTLHGQVESILRKKIPRVPKNKTSVCHAGNSGNYLCSIYIVSGILCSIEMI